MAVIMRDKANNAQYMCSLSVHVQSLAQKENQADSVGAMALSKGE